MMKSTFVIGLIVLSCVCARATVTFNIYATELRTAGGTSLMAQDRLVLLVADTGNNGFGSLIDGAPLTVNSFLSGDDLILFRGDLSGGDLGYLIGVANFPLGGNNLGAGDAVRLYWFPTLTLSSTTAGEGNPYGSYRHGTGVDGSAPWVVPNDGANLDLKFFTTGNNQGEPFGGGPASNDPTLGWASQTVAPIPEASNVITAVLALGLCAFRVTRGLRQKS